jgi:hypothetical protein
MARPSASAPAAPARASPCDQRSAICAPIPATPAASPASSTSRPLSQRRNGLRGSGAPSRRIVSTGDARALAQARKRFMRLHGRVFWILGMMQWVWYRSDTLRERFVSICKDKHGVVDAFAGSRRDDARRVTREQHIASVVPAPQRLEAGRAPRFPSSRCGAGTTDAMCCSRVTRRASSRRLPLHHPEDPEDASVQPHEPLPRLGESASVAGREEGARRLRGKATAEHGVVDASSRSVRTRTSSSSPGTPT